MPATFTCPLIVVIPGQIISASLWNNEFSNIYTNFVPAGMDSYSQNDTIIQTMEDPYPGSVISRPTSLQGELTRIRFVENQTKGTTYWYQPSPVNLTQLSTHDHSASGVGSPIVTAGITDGAVTNAKLASNSVDNSKIANASITVAKLSDYLVPNSVITGAIQDSAITTSKVADGNITTVKLADSNVTTAKIADGSITAAKFASGAIPFYSLFGFPAQAIHQSDGLVTIISSGSPGLFHGCGFDSGVVFGGAPGTATFTVIIDGGTYTATTTVGSPASGKFFFQFDRSGLSLGTSPGIPVGYKSQFVFKVQITGAGDGRNTLTAYCVYQDPH